VDEKDSLRKEKKKNIRETKTKMGIPSKKKESGMFDQIHMLPD